MFVWGRNADVLGVWRYDGCQSRQAEEYGRQYGVARGLRSRWVVKVYATCVVVLGRGVASDDDG